MRHSHGFRSVAQAATSSGLLLSDAAGAKEKPTAGRQAAQHDRSCVRGEVPSAAGVGAAVSRRSPHDRVPPTPCATRDDVESPVTLSSSRWV
jgi:hypothetical protein